MRSIRSSRAVADCRHPLSRKWGPSGTVCTTGSSANALLNRKIIETGNIGFDPVYGRTGGEDTDFFGRLSAAGENRGGERRGRSGMGFARSSGAGLSLPARHPCGTILWCRQARPILARRPFAVYGGDPCEGSDLFHLRDRASRSRAPTR